MTAVDVLPNKTRRPRDAEAERNRLLDAARTEFCRHGLRQASIAAIARRADVSQPTLYRRCGTKDEIIAAVVTREVLQAFTRLEAATKDLATAEERLVEAWVLGVCESRTNDLVHAMRDFDPDTLTGRMIRPEDGQHRLIRTAIVEIFHDDTIDRTAAEQAVELVIRIIATLLMAPTPVLPLDTDEASRTFAERYLVPLVAAARLGPL